MAHHNQTSEQQACYQIDKKMIQVNWVIQDKMNHLV